MSTDLAAIFCARLC